VGRAERPIRSWGAWMRQIRASAARCGVQLEREAQSNVVKGLKLMNICHQI
jgi:hypothetical protein